jgi:hypothetical protein
VSVNRNEAQEILGEARQYRLMAPCDVSGLQVAIESQNGDEIRKLVKQVQQIATDDLIDVYKRFIDSLQTSSTQKKSICLIL